MLEVEGLEVCYGALKALEKVCLRVDKGEVVAIIGANGAGKSTLLKAVSHLLQPSCGSIRFMGKDVTRMPAHQMIRMGVTLVPEGRQLFESLSVLENLEMGAYIRHHLWCVEKRTGTTIAEDLAKVYELFPILKERRGQPAGFLSGGQQQMLAIGRALMSNPVLLLVDEPSLGLSPLLKVELLATLGRLRERGLALLLVEQDITASLTIADRAYVMENGKIVLEGKGPELLKRKEVRQRYLGGI